MRDFPSEKNTLTQAGFAETDAETPFFVWDIDQLEDTASRISSIAKEVNAHLLYSLKACPHAYICDVLNPFISGFACSSINEGVLAKRSLQNWQTLHLASPIIKDCECDDALDLFDYVSANSISQWEKVKNFKSYDQSCSVGIRLNTGVRAAQDKRYDPARRGSKLGLPIKEKKAELLRATQNGNLEGIHFHTNCESFNLGTLRKNYLKLAKRFPGLLRQAAWINLGGGYMLDEIKDTRPLQQVCESAISEFGLKVFIEPGGAFVQKAGSIVSTVVDIFESGGNQIVVLDTTVNHVPEVFEYQYSPIIEGQAKSGKFKYKIVGRTCLAGDTFGKYRFNRALEIGDRIVIREVGSYSMSKFHMFNGIDLPSVYACSSRRGYELISKYGRTVFDSLYNRNGDAPALHNSFAASSGS